MTIPKIFRTILLCIFLYGLLRDILAVKALPHVFNQLSVTAYFLCSRPATSHITTCCNRLMIACAFNSCWLNIICWYKHTYEVLDYLTYLINGYMIWKSLASESLHGSAVFIIVIVYFIIFVSYICIILLITYFIIFISYCFIICLSWLMGK